MTNLLSLVNLTESVFTESIVFESRNTNDNFVVCGSRVVWLKAGQPYKEGMIVDYYEVLWDCSSTTLTVDMTVTTKIPVFLNKKTVEHYRGGHNTNDRLGTTPVGVDMPYAPGRCNPLWWGRTTYGRFTGAWSDTTVVRWPMYEYWDIIQYGIVETPFRTREGSKIIYVKSGGIDPVWAPLLLEGEFLKPREYIHPELLNTWFTSEPSVEKVIKLLSSDSNLITE